LSVSNFTWLPCCSDGYQQTIEGCVRYIEDWIELIKPEYLMASTPAGTVCIVFID
jgi:hypothetical protein